MRWNWHNVLWPRRRRCQTMCRTCRAHKPARRYPKCKRLGCMVSPDVHDRDVPSRCDKWARECGLALHAGLKQGVSGPQASGDSSSACGRVAVACDGSHPTDTYSAADWHCHWVAGSAQRLAQHLGLAAMHTSAQQASALMHRWRHLHPHINWQFLTVLVQVHWQLYLWALQPWGPVCGVAPRS
jgi:hypothetical protein